MTKVKFTLTEDQHDRLLSAGKPVPYIIIGNMEPESPYEKSMRIWREIAKEHNVLVKSIRPEGSSEYECTGDEDLTGNPFPTSMP